MEYMPLKKQTKQYVKMSLKYSFEFFLFGFKSQMPTKCEYAVNQNES